MSSMTAYYVNQEEEEEEEKNANEAADRPAGIQQQFSHHNLFRSC